MRYFTGEFVIVHMVGAEWWGRVDVETADGAYVILAPRTSPVFYLHEHISKPAEWFR